MQSVASRQASNLNVAQGNVIISQGEPSANLILLHQGKAEFQLAIANQDQKPSAKKVYLAGSPSVLGAASLLLGRPYPYSAVTVSPSVLTTAPGDQETLLKFFVSQPNVVPLLFRSISKEAADILNKINTIGSTSTNLARYITSLSLAYLKINPEMLQKAQTAKEEDKTLMFSWKAHQSFTKKGGEVPNDITMDFLKSNHLDAEAHKTHLNVNFDQDGLNYCHRFTNLPPQILGAISAHDPKLILMTAKKMANISSSLLRGLMESNEHLEDKLDLLFHPEYGWVNKVHAMLRGRRDAKKLSAWENMGKMLVSIIGLATKQYQSIWSDNGLSERMDRNAIKQIEEFVSARESAPGGASSEPQHIQVDPRVLDATRNMAKKVFDYAGLTERFSEYTELSQKLKKMYNPLSSDTPIRKIRRGINQLFWNAYEMGILKHFKDKDQLPRYMEIFFNFGILEEDLLEKDQLAFLYNAKESESSGRYLLHTPIEWLKRIYEKENPTSINELGLSFFEIVRQNNRDRSWKKESDLPPDVDSSQARLSFEIQNMLASTTRLTSGSVVTYLAPLSKHQIIQSLERSFVSKHVIEQNLDKLLDVDFSCFHREVLYQSQEMGILREFIQLQVIPNIIMTPTAGSIFQHWQEREGKNKTSPGRLCCPSITTDEFYKLLLNAVGCYRWEMTKTIMGPDWNNISHSSITADYTDYVQFFKKNRDLSPEMKEKLSHEFRRLRDDRSRFVHDYATWVMFESDGTQRLNKVSRKIMAKHIPFRKPYREKLLKLPSYIDLVNKGINIHRRKAREMEPRLKKYRQSNQGQLPEELIETFRFYNMEY